MIFDFTEKIASNMIDSVENAGHVVMDGLLLDADRDRVVRLLADGLEIAAIATATGVATDVIEAIKSDQ